MMFKVTHIDPSGHRRKARVSAVHSGDAMEQMDAVYGEAQGGACIRMAVKPALRLQPRQNRAVFEQQLRVWQ